MTVWNTDDDCETVDYPDDGDPQDGQADKEYAWRNSPPLPTAHYSRNDGRFSRPANTGTITSRAFSHNENERELTGGI